MIRCISSIPWQINWGLEPGVGFRTLVHGYGALGVYIGVQVRKKCNVAHRHFACSNSLIPSSHVLKKSLKSAMSIPWQKIWTSTSPVLSSAPWCTGRGAPRV